MPKHLLAAAALASVIASTLSIPAYALPSIPSGSEINVTGSAMFDATTIIFLSPGSVPVGGTTGAFTAFAPCQNCVTMTSPITYNPFTPGTLYVGSSGGVEVNFTLQANTLTENLGSDLIIHDTGTASLSGFADTKGVLDLTINKGVLSGSFSSTVTSSGGGGGGVPEPASLALLGAGLVGLGCAKYRKSIA